MPLRKVLRCFRTFLVHPMMRHIFPNAPMLNCKLVLTLNHKLFRCACVCKCMCPSFCLSVYVRMCLFVCVFHVRVYVRVYVRVRALCVDQIGGRCSWSTSSVLCAQCQVPCSMRLSDHLCVFSVMSLRRCDAPMWSMLCSLNTHLVCWFILIFILSAQIYISQIISICAQWSANT